MQVNTRYINSTKGTSSAQTQSRFDAKEKYWQGSGRSDQAASLHSFHRLFVPGVLIHVCWAQTTVVSQIWFMLVTVVLHKHFWMTANTFSEQKEPWSCDNASLLCTDKTVVCHSHSWSWTTQAFWKDSKYIFRANRTMIMWNWCHLEMSSCNYPLKVDGFQGTVLSATR